MDLLAALSLVLVLEGLAVAIFAGSLPELLAAMRGLSPERVRGIGIAMVATGAVAYLLIRG